MSDNIYDTVAQILPDETPLGDYRKVVSEAERYAGARIREEKTEISKRLKKIEDYISKSESGTAPDLVTAARMLQVLRTSLYR